MSHTTRVTAPPAGVGAAAERGGTSGRARPPRARWHPSSLEWDTAPPAPGTERTVRARAPKLVTAGMVLVAAAALFEGYGWLNVIPADALRLSALVFAAVAVPSALLLTRKALTAVHRSTLVAAEAASVGLLAITVLHTLVDRPWSARALGAYDLLMAAAVLGAAVVGGGFSST